MANGYVSTGLVAASTSLFAIAVLAIGWSTVVSWANQRKTEGQQSPAVKTARLHQAIGVTLFFVGSALTLIDSAMATWLAAEYSGTDRDIDQEFSDVVFAATIVAIIGSFISIVGSVLMMVALHISSVSAYYVVVSRQRWWKFFQIDAWCGIGLMVLFAIIWTAVLLDAVIQGKSVSVNINWLHFVIWFALDIIALCIFIGAIYVRSKFKERSDLVPGNLVALILTASFLELVRCSYWCGIVRQAMRDDTSDTGYHARLILDPIFSHWVQATVIILTNVVLGRPIWAHAPTVDVPPPQQPMYVYPFPAPAPAPAPAPYPAHYSMYGYPQPYAQPAETSYSAQGYYASTGQSKPSPAPVSPPVAAPAALATPPPLANQPMPSMSTGSTLTQPLAHIYEADNGSVPRTELPADPAHMR